MPELPEVETIKRQLAPVAEGRRIESVTVTDERWIKPSTVRRFRSALAGRTIDRLIRRGKYLRFELDDGSVLLMHLRMTGNLLAVATGATSPAPHGRGELVLDGGVRLVFSDPRRFGTAAIFESRDDADAQLDARLGPEPFSDDFTPESLYATARRRRVPVKSLLLDQRVVAGIGNIYADEALFRAGISPLRPADRLGRAGCERLRAAILEALRAGIAANGASIGDYRDAYGVPGRFQDEFLVHRRAGLPCPHCDAPIVKARVGGRGTYYCPSCQSR